MKYDIWANKFGQLTAIPYAESFSFSDNGNSDHSFSRHVAVIEAETGRGAITKYRAQQIENIDCESMDYYLAELGDY